MKFRPGGFRPFLGRPLVEITDTVLPAERLWGAAATALAARLAAAPDPAELVGLVEVFLRERWPAPDPQVELVERMVPALLHDRAITRVDDVTAPVRHVRAHAAAALPALRRREPEMGAAPLPAARGRRGAGQ